MKTYRSALIAAALLLPALFALAYLSHINKDGGSAAADAAQTHSDATPHAPNMQSFGQHHAQALIDQKGNIQVLLYGLQAGELMPVPQSEIVEAAIVIPGEDSEPLTLQPRPYKGEPTGRSSRWVGKWGNASRVPVDAMGVGMMLTLQHDERTYRIQWQPNQMRAGYVADAHVDPSMPQAASPEEAKTFLTPGGLYTAADIAANGGVTPAQKFRGLMARHNLTPASGARLCPITNTAADERFAWIVGGKTYRFCCPPCVEEFVRKAKEKPDTIKSPDAYVKP